MMGHRQKIGGIAALIEAATFSFSIAMFITVLSAVTGSLNPVASLGVSGGAVGVAFQPPQ